MEPEKIASSKYSFAFPVFITLLLIGWTIIVSPYSQYGDNWAILPALIMVPIVFFWHMFLIFYNRGKEKKILFSFYAVIHFLMFLVIWFYCLMKISKDCL
jgi:hypothetical protein